MFSLTANNFVLTIAAAVLILAIISFLVGLFTLAFKISSGEFSEISAHSAKLMSKGVTDDVSDLVGNASSLLESIASMTKTKAGVGIFLILVSFIFLVIAYYLVSTIL